ncbi:Replication initiator protein A [Methylocapsa palsarum]|uniref:Replication initiator protein A n=1 Tax=Methylocapsa palsarum TaxID=1612308 RepID=A0A1I4BLQ5_9HYPH|nr:Replication initiator protein A [Methylocapsa palsarum]
MPDRFYRAVLDDALVLTIDRDYFALSGGMERWLYRLVRKHAGRQPSGWRFDFRHLHIKSASLSPFKRFAFELRDIARRQPLPGYRLIVEREIGGRELLVFMRAELSTGTCGQAVESLVLSGTGSVVPSGTRASCYQEPKPALRHWQDEEIRALNLESNIESNVTAAGADKSEPDPRHPAKGKRRNQGQAQRTFFRKAASPKSGPSITSELAVTLKPGGAS